MRACVHVYVFVQLEMRKVQTILDVLFSFLKWRYESDHTLEIFLYVRSPRVFCNVEILKRCFGLVRNTIICLCKAEISAAQRGCFLCGAHLLNVQFPRVYFYTGKTLNRLIPPDGNGYWYSGYLAVSGGRKDRYLEVFEYIVDREEVDKEDERENNRVCIFRVACLGVEEESDSLCLSLKENFQWGKQMSTSYLMIPDSCDQRGGGISMFVCVCAYTV